MNECYLLSFDIDFSRSYTTAAVLEEVPKGYSVVKYVRGEEACELYEKVTGRDVAEAWIMTND